MDLLFAETVLALREKNAVITLEAVIPYRNRLKSPDAAFQSVLARCNKVSVIQEEYQRSCFMERNRVMVQNSGRVIAVYDGRENGGTFFTVRYARVLERDVQIIYL